MNATLRTALAVVCIAVISLCAVLLFGRLAGRSRVADLTENHLYTLSGGTKAILAKLNQPITLKLYYSRVAARKGPEQIRFWNNYYLYVRDLVDEYVSRAKGKLRLEIVDPRPFSEQEEAAIRSGVRRFQLSEDESFFFGLVATTELGKDKVIEFFEPNRQEFVEYDISKLISGLIQREKKKIGVISSLPVTGTDMSPYMQQMLQLQGKSPEGPWTIVEHLGNTYDAEKVEVKDARIPDDIDFLLVVHPKNLDKETLFAIDQYVMKGGKLMVFVDPHCVVDQPQRNMQNPYMQMDQKSDSNLNVLLEKWGVKLDTGKIAVDRTLAVTVPLGRDQSPVPFPAFLDLNGECTNHQQVVTADLHSLRMLFPGSLERVDGAGTEVQSILHTTSVGNTWKPSSPFELKFPDAKAINDAVTDGTVPIMLACVITGKFKTNYPDGIEVRSEAKTEEGKEGVESEPGETEAEPAKPKTEAKAADKPATEAKGAKGEPGEAGTKKAEEKKPEPAKAEGEKPKTEAKAAEKPKTEAKAEGEKPAEPKKEETPPEPETRRIKAVTEAAEGATVFVVADVDLLTDMLAYQRTFFGKTPSGDNASFLLNMVDYLSGANDLIAVRTRGQYNRPFKVVDEIEQEADKATADEVKVINAKIESYQKQLQELGNAATDANIEVIHSEALAKRRTIEAEIREANKELRRLQAKRRERVEALAASLQTWNMVAAPSIILLIAITLAAVRWTRAKRYSSRRPKE